MGLTEILTMDHLPKVGKVYSLVLRHERQGDVSAGKGMSQPYAAAFVVQDLNKKGGSSKCDKCDKTGHNTENCRAYLKCTHCGWKGHTVDLCGKLKKESDQRFFTSRGNHVASQQSKKNDISNSFHSLKSSVNKSC